MRRRRARSDDTLTPREWDVLKLMREGLTNEQIAERLGISFGTAKYHVAEVLSKLGVSSRLEAVEVAKRPRWLHAAVPSLRRSVRHTTGNELPRLGLLAGASALAVLVVLFAVLVLTALIGRSHGREPALGQSSVGLDVASNGLDAFHEARLSTPYRHTVLLSKGMPVNVGNQGDVIASLPRVETFEQLQAALTYDINVIVVDASAMDELPSVAFLHEQWQSGRAIVGLNACFSDLPYSRDAQTFQGVVTEISPSGEVRHVDTRSQSPSASRCSVELRLAEAGFPYLTYAPRPLTLDEVQAYRSMGINQFISAGGERLDLPTQSYCWVRDLLSTLDKDGHAASFHWEWECE